MNKTKNCKNYSYASCFDDNSFLYTYHSSVHPGIPTEDIIWVGDKEEERTEFDKLVKRVKKGDVVAIASIFALEDDGKEKSILVKLRKLDRKGAIIRVALDPKFSFSQLDTMFRQQEHYTQQKDLYMSLSRKMYDI